MATLSKTNMRAVAAMPVRKAAPLPLAKAARVIAPIKLNPPPQLITKPPAPKPAPVAASPAAAPAKQVLNPEMLKKVGKLHLVKPAEEVKTDEEKTKDWRKRAHRKWKEEQKKKAEEAAAAGAAGAAGGAAAGSGGSAASSQEDERETESESPQYVMVEEGQQAPPTQEEQEEALEEAEDSDEYYSEQEEEEGIVAGELSMPFVSSHVHRGHLHTAAIALTPQGCSTVLSKVRCPGQKQSGLVSFHGENPEWLEGPIDATKMALILKAREIVPSKEIGAVIRRARAGDQNAMALIVQVRENAAAGDEVAKRSEKAMLAYVDAHPPESDMGAEPEPRSEKEHNRAVVTFANGLMLGKTQIQAIRSQFGEEKHQNVFIYGIMRPWNPTDAGGKELEAQLDDFSQTVLEVARIVGQARQIQKVRLPDSSISGYNPVIGWELGE
jgi:hypothetical protein